MGEATSRKDLIQQYKERPKVGGVFVIRNSVNGKLLLSSSVDLQSSQNRFAFAVSTGSCIDLALQKDWEKQKGVGFTLEVLEEVAQGETQSAAEFKEDVLLLKEIWQERLSNQVVY